MTHAECETAGFHVGTTYSGRVVHRAGKGATHWFADCGQPLSRVHRTVSVTTAGAHWPLCERCFTADERHALFLHHMGLS